MESKYIKDGHVTDWAAYMDEEDAYEAQNSQNQSQGSEDHTLIGNQESKTYNDSTGFLTSGKVITSDYDRAPEDTTLLSSLHPMVESEHTIRKILTRPVKIATVTFLTSQTAGTQIYPAGVDVLNTLRTAPGFRLAREKISGFYGIHMTAVLKVTLNPQPFESGMFQIYFVPMVNTYTPVVSPTQTPPELILPFSTGCPNVLCNIGIQSEVELAVPYTGPSPFINMTNMNSDFGTFYIQSLVPINDSTNNASCEMSIYLYFQNVQLFGASPRTWTLQGDLPSEKQEADSKTSGNPLKSSGPLSQLSSSIRSTVNDVADDVQPILDMLGLSVPDANPNPQRFHQDPYASFATVDTTKTPLKTSYTFSHHLDIGQLGIDKNDEMDLVYIAQKPCYYNQFTWNTTQDAGTQLYSYKVEPNCILHQSQETTTLVAPTRLRYISNCFRYWRGTIQFTFHVVANKFHSGRLRFVLSLGGELPSNRLSELYPYAFSQIVDLRDSTTFVVQVPYFASTPYRIMPQTYDDASSSYIVNGGVSSLEDEVPRLQVFIENELRAPDTTSNSIQIVCMQSAGMDFEFATPVVSTSYPYLPTPATLQGDCAMVINMVSQKYRKQMDSLSKDHFKYTVGERISSVRQLIKRPQLVGAGTIDYADAQFRDFLLYPFCFYVPSDSTGLTGDTLQYFRYLYRFFRGSLRFLVTTRDPQTQFTLRYDADGMNLSNNITTQLGSFGTRTPILSVTDYASGNLTSLPLSATIPFFSPLQGGMEFEIPYYSRFHKLGTSFTRDLTTYEADITSGREPAGLAFLQIYSDNEKPDTYVHFFRYASDDFTLGYLLGAPLCSYGGVPSS